MTDLVLLPTENKTPIRDIISLISLIIATILVPVASFLAFGTAIGLLALGLVFYVPAILFGLRK